MKVLNFTNLGICLVGFLVSAPAIFASQSSCNLPNYKLCIESPSLDLTKECSSNGGILGSTCPIEQRTGSCTKKQGEHLVYLRYYAGVAFDPVQNCADNGGVYTPGNWPN